MFQRISVRGSRLLIAGLATLLLLLGLPAVAHAAGSLHITGTVTNQGGGGVLNVSVTATAPGGSTVLFGPSMTAADGSYQLDVDPGTYDIHFDPAAGSGLSPIISSNLVVQTDQSVNVQLIPILRILSGTVADSDGQLLTGVSLTFRQEATPGSTTVTTDANGHYELISSGGKYFLSDAAGTAPAPLGSLALPVTSVTLLCRSTTSGRVTWSKISWCQRPHSM